MYSQLGERKREISSGPFFLSFFLQLIVTRDYAWLGESSAKKKKKKKKKRFVFFFLCSFFLFSSSSPFSFFLFISFSCHQDSLSPLQLFFLPQHIIRGQGSWKRVPYTFVRFPFSFIELTAGLAPFVLFILFFSFLIAIYLTWSIFLSFALLRIWVFFWHCIVIGSSLILRAIDAVFIQGRISPIPKYRLYYPLGFRQQLL